MMQHKYATAYLFADRLVLHSHLQTPYGLFACRPFVRVDGAVSKGYQPVKGVAPVKLVIGAAPADIGAALMNAFTLCTRA